MDNQQLPVLLQRLLRGLKLLTFTGLFSCESDNNGKNKQQV